VATVTEVVSNTPSSKDFQRGYWFFKTGIFNIADMGGECARARWVAFE